MTYDTLEEEIHAIGKELCYYRNNRLQIAKYTNMYGEVRHVLEFIKIDNERYTTVCHLSDRFVDMLLINKYFKLKRNKVKHRREVISTSNVVTDYNMYDILKSCSRKLVIDEIIQDLEHG